MIESYLGEVRLFAGDFAPMNWAFCDGRIMPAAQHPALFVLLGDRFGGDARTHFALPELGPLKADQGELMYIICIEGRYPPHG